MSIKVGLLLPRSAIYPSMGFDMLGGFKNGLAEGGIADAIIQTENIGIATDDKLIYAAFEKMIFDGCSVVAGYVNPLSAEKLQVLAAGGNTIFLALDAGYHYPTSMAKLPNVFTISLQGALCARINAARAVRDGSGNIAFTGSFYDTGYRSIHGFHRGLEDAGGAITFNHFTKLKRQDFTLEPLAEHLRANPDDAVMAAFCGDMLQDFCAAAAAGNWLELHNVYGSSFMGDEYWLAQCVYPGTDIKVCVPWATGLETDGNKRFMQVMGEKKVKTNIFSVLGWEAGLAAAHTTGGADESIRVLEGWQYNGPRGTVTLDAATHYAYSPVYEAVVRKNNDTGNCVAEVMREAEDTEQQREKLEHDINNPPATFTSWHNAYGCLDT